MPFGGWPAAPPALHRHSVELPKLGACVEHAKIVAAALGAPEPHTHQFALYLPNSAERINPVRGDVLAKFWPSAVPGLATTEVTVAEPAIEWTHDEIVDAYAAFVASV